MASLSMWGEMECWSVGDRVPSGATVGIALAEHRREPSRKKFPLLRRLEAHQSDVSRSIHTKRRRKQKRRVHAKFRHKSSETVKNFAYLLC